MFFHDGQQQQYLNDFACTNTPFAKPVLSPKRATQAPLLV